jgi:hypothetical protein
MTNSSLEYFVSPANHTHNHATHHMVMLVGPLDEYRYICMTYMERGAKSQIFTSVCYPWGNLPILGIDLLQFAGSKHHLNIYLSPFTWAHSTSHSFLTRTHDGSIIWSRSVLFETNPSIGTFWLTDTIWQDLWPAYQALPNRSTTTTAKHLFCFCFYRFTIKLGRDKNKNINISVLSQNKTEIVHPTGTCATHFSLVLWQHIWLIETNQLLQSINYSCQQLITTCCQWLITATSDYSTTCCQQSIRVIIDYSTAPHLLFTGPWCHWFYGRDRLFSTQKASVVGIDDKVNGTVNRF